MTDTVAEMSVESALNELREMFPGEMNLGINRSGGDGYIAQRGRMVIRREFWTIHRKVFEIIGRGLTLNDAMNKARAWKEQQ